jgi:DNA polymerase-3 subunit delta'
MWRTIGQQKAIAFLKHSLAAESPAHAFLFTGPAHIGKLTMAFDLAQALNCQSDDLPCGKCISCERILKGNHSDVMLIDLDNSPGTRDTASRSKISINDIKEIERSASLFPYEGIYKVFIINGAENMSREASNSLLKILEEPPPQVIFALTTTDEAQLLPTVISRCQRIELAPLSTAEIENVLLRSYGIDHEQARLIARLSGGCPGWALTASMNDTYLNERLERLSRITPLLTASWEERFTYASQFENNRKKAEDILYTWLTWCRDILLAKCDCKEHIINIDHMSIIETWSRMLTLQEIISFTGYIELSLNALSRNANLRLLFETMMLELPVKTSMALAGRDRSAEMSHA